MQVEYSGRDDTGYVARTPPGRSAPQTFRSVLGWAVAVLLAATVVVVARAVELVEYWRNYALLRDFEDRVSSAEHLRELEGQTALSWASSVALFAQLVCGVLFVIWTYRSRRNTELLCAATHRLPSGWAIAGFLPIVNWFLPPVVVDDIQRASDPATPPNAARLAANSTTPLVVIWWIGFVTGSTLLFAASLFGIAPRSGAAGTDRAALGMLIGFGGLLLLVAAAVTLAVIVVRVTRWQEARASAIVPADGTAHLQPPVSIQRNPGRHIAPPPRRPLEPVGVLGAVAAGLSLTVVAATAVVAMAVSGYGSVENTKKGTAEYEAAMDDWAPWILSGLAMWTLAVFSAGSVFLFWLLRARINAEILDPDAQRLGRGWALGGWFVPVGNFIVPAIVVDDVYRVSHRGSSPLRWPVVTWWLAWVAAWVVGWIGLAYLVAPMLWMSALLYALAAVPLTTVILRIDAGQRTAFTRSDSSSSALGPSA
ncbi:DUF4328 domain-containing protein [Nocardia gipuzkoensis]